MEIIIWLFILVSVVIVVGVWMIFIPYPIERFDEVLVGSRTRRIWKAKVEHDNSSCSVIWWSWWRYAQYEIVTNGTEEVILYSNPRFGRAIATHFRLHPSYDGKVTKFISPSRSLEGEVINQLPPLVQRFLNRGRKKLSRAFPEGAFKGSPVLGEWNIQDPSPWLHPVSMLK